ncbi:MAG: hypothetical protein R3E42_10305 [Burkholderiaceae bacterium]
MLERALAQSHHHDTATRMANSVRLLGSSLDAMLDISRLDAGTIEVNRRPVALQRLFEALNSLFSAQAGERAWSFGCDPAACGSTPTPTCCNAC